MKIKDVNKTMVLKHLESMDKSYTKAGFPNGEPVAGGEASTMSEVALIAYINEKGSEHIPPRPFMRRAYRKSLKKIRPMLLEEAQMIQRGRSTVKKSLAIIGEYSVLEIRHQITSGRFKANALSTQKAKGRKNGVKMKVNAPLRDTGQMLQTVQHIEVVK